MERIPQRGFQRNRYRFLAPFPAHGWSGFYTTTTSGKIAAVASALGHRQERQILRHGAPLSEQEIFYAKIAGVKAPERVRVLHVDAIPEPAHPMLKAAYAALDQLPEKPRGLTLRYGILVRSDAVQDRYLLIHELVHTAQYERLGGIKAFLKKYLLECLTIGYRNAPLEQEANAIAMRVCSA